MILLRGGKHMALQRRGEASQSGCNFTSAGISYLGLHCMRSSVCSSTPTNKKKRRLRSRDPKTIIANASNFKDLVFLHTSLLRPPAAVHAPQHLAGPDFLLGSHCATIDALLNSTTELLSSTSPSHYSGNKAEFHTAAGISADDFSKLQSLKALLGSSLNIDVTVENRDIYNNIMDSFSADLLQT
ncbi:hypothetical protein KP509_10G023700 [Ceratopteris richardii]|uniref:Uncharacterized protein n=1 Tax=Ceratopteris richardii TaxID=49495 RepID=A0A8T2TU68_CERRI|nr:hypothetical protein KP509_10G023700 [Ceratopteris richardii]